MYPVSELYKQKIKENNRIFECKIQIEHSQGTLYLDDKDLVAGSLTYTESSQAGEEFTIGGTVASDIGFTILNKPEYENIVFMGATVFVNIGLQIQEGIDAHFLQPSQPSKIPGFEEKWEYVPLGIFHIDDVKRLRNTIELKAIDNMINLDKPYSLSKLSYPATLYQIYVNICNVADIPVGTTSFPNMNYVVNIRPDDDLTLRDVLGYVAELSGTFAKCNRHGALELRWYEPTDITLGPENRFNFKPSDDVIQIKGVMATIDGTTYLAGSDEYAIDLSENPLLQGDYETVLPNILDNVKDTVFTPYTSDWQGNPAIQAGDIIQQIDRDGKVYNTLVTKSVYKYRGRSILEAKGLPELARGYKGSTNRKIAEIKRKIDVEIGDKLTTLEEAQLQATQLIANMLGGYAIKTDDAFYIADNEDLSKAQKVWKWGLGGFGYSENGVDGPYTTAVTADGSIVAMLVSAGIVTADMVQTGILQSEDGSTWINLDNGSFNFKNLIKLENGQLRLESPDIPPPVDISGLEREIENIKDLDTTLAGSVVTIDGNRIRVSHDGTNQYSEMRADGFVRKYANGEAEYLNGLYVNKYKFDGGVITVKPPPVRVTLPKSFYGRGSKSEIFLTHTGMHVAIGRFNIDITNRFETVLQVVDSNFYASTPWVDVESYIRQDYELYDGTRGIDYGRLDFLIMVVGR